MAINTASNKNLLLKYAFGLALTETEQIELTELRGQLRYFPDLADQLRNPNWVAQQLGGERHYPKAEVWHGILERIEEEKIVLMEKNMLDDKDTELVEDHAVSRIKFYVGMGTILVVIVEVSILSFWPRFFYDHNLWVCFLINILVYTFLYFRNRPRKGRQ